MTTTDKSVNVKVLLWVIGIAITIIITLVGGIATLAGSRVESVDEKVGTLRSRHLDDNRDTTEAIRMLEAKNATEHDILRNDQKAQLQLLHQMDLKITRIETAITKRGSP